MGTSDLVFRPEHLAVFVDGCFWHGCKECYREPKSNQAYWTMKVQRNKERDTRVNDALKADGWTVLRYWEHEVLKNASKTSNSIKRALTKARTKKVKRSA
jgi:DNA mismatch endonuclease (patch repair protein)